MTGALTKFSTGQNVSFFIIGDSTAFGLDDGQNINGWVGRLGIHFGNYYDYNVALRQYNSGTASYAAPISLRTSALGGSAPTLTIFAGTVSGTYASGDIISILTGNLVPISNPDVTIIGTGINDTFFQTLSPAEYTVEMNLLIAYLMNIYCPGVPVIVTTQNPTSSAPEFVFSTLVANYSAMAQSLVGSPVPLSAPMVQNPNNNVSVLDTLQAYRSQYQLSLFAGANPDEHPNQWGYAVQAYWMASVLAPWIVTPIGAKMPPLRIANPKVGPQALRRRKRRTQIVRRWEANVFTASIDSSWTLETTFAPPIQKLIVNSDGQLVVRSGGAPVTSAQAQ
ncbi:Uncharacterised protein [Mycobacterium tuberculosis]|nr:Uncharacterised protein [Mycobacterium tuberculosis]